MERGRFCLADSQNVVQFRPEYTCAVILQPIHFQKQPPQGVRRIQAYTLVGYGIQTVAATFPQVSCADKTEVAGLRFGAGFIVGVSLFCAVYRQGEVGDFFRLHGKGYLLFFKNIHVAFDNICGRIRAEKVVFFGGFERLFVGRENTAENAAGFRFPNISLK